MQLERKFFRPEQLGKLALAALLIIAVFSSLLLSASPSLHEQIHPDSAQSSHQCAITIFQQHHLLAGSSAAFIFHADPGVLLKKLASNQSALSDYAYRFSASRAPPFAFSSLS